MAAKRYYWLKLKEDFFDDDTIQWIEEQPNGQLYCLFYLKLCLRSIKTDGVLVRKVGQMFIPYDVDKLAEITKTPVDTVRVAMELFKNLGIIQILENGEICISQFEDMVGSETDKAALMRKKRAAEKAEQLENTEVKQLGNGSEHDGNNVTEMLENRYIEKDKEIRERVKEKDKDIRQKEKDKKENPALVTGMFENICHSLPLGNPSKDPEAEINAAFDAGYTLNDFEEVFRKAEASSFLRGENDHKWQASFMWLIKAKNVKKVLSGKYDDKRQDSGDGENVTEEDVVAEIIAAARESPEDPDRVFDSMSETCRAIVRTPQRLRNMAHLKDEAIRELVGGKVEREKT